MKDSSTLLISILVVTAIILSLLLFPIQTAAENSGNRTRDGDYITITASATGSSSLIYVIHVPSQRMVVYVANKNNNTVRLVHAVKLNDLF